MFKYTKLLGIKIPFHTNFEEVNLRFYVKCKSGDTWKHGVLFIKEIVPKSTITFISNTVYKENNETREMKHEWLLEKENKSISYEWKTESGWQSLSVIAEAKNSIIPENPLTEFIAEHYWGMQK